MTVFSKHYSTTTPGGAGADPAMRTVAAYSNLAAERAAELESLTPAPVTVTLKRVTGVEGGGYALVPLSRPVEFTPTHKSQMPSRFAKLDLEGAALLDSFFEGGEAWRLAPDEQVYQALLAAIEEMAPGGEGAGAGHVYRGENEPGGAVVGGTRGFDAEETAAEIPLDKTTLPRSGFLSRVVAPLGRLVNYALLVRRGAGDVRLLDVPTN